jgi:putative nucleotide binding protein
MERASKKYEEHAYVLDILHHGRPGVARSSFYGRVVIQIVGEDYFTLLEAVPVKGAEFNIGERIYVGKKGRTKIEHILGRINYDDLTSPARAELSLAVEAIVRANEERFVAFFNKSQPLTPRMHSMELIPGIGKRLMWQILENRERVPFDSFDDLQNRINLSDPVKLLVRRIIGEFTENEKYKLFVRPT